MATKKKAPAAPESNELLDAAKNLLTAMDMVAQARWDPSRLEEAKDRMQKAIDAA